MKIKVGVIFGGETVEHEVSIISALQAIKNINEDKYEVVPIYIDKNRNWYTGMELLNIDNYKNSDFLFKNIIPITLCKFKDEFWLLREKGLFKRVEDKIDIAFPIVHGANVEDGSIVGYLESIGIPYVGSGILGSAIGQDKVVMKQLMKSEGLPIVDYVWFYDYEYVNDEEKTINNISKLNFPVIVKPARLGSSVGISVAHNVDELKQSIVEAVKYDEKIVVEKVISDLIEVNASVLGNNEYAEVSALEEVMGIDEFLSYKDKYIGGKKGTKSKGMANTNRVIPARISDKLSSEINELSLKVFRLFNLSGVVRIDYLVDNKNGKVYVNEPNIIPGSLSFYLWKEKGKDYKTLLDDLITLAIKNYKKKKKKIYSFESNILENINGLKGAKGFKGKLKM